MKNFIKLSSVWMAMLPLIIFAQQPAQVPLLTLSGQVGYARPQGNAFKDAKGDALVKLGIGMDFDLLYHLEQLDRKLGVGLTYNSSFLFGLDVDGLDVGVYGHSLYGAKAHYKFLGGGFSPYVSLSLGLSQLVVPEITDIAGHVLRESTSSSSFGLRPEVGLQMGGFIMSVGYFVPMRYDLHNNTRKSAGSLQFSIGVRLKLWTVDE